jgi:hypothetical protein
MRCGALLRLDGRGAHPYTSSGWTAETARLSLARVLLDGRAACPHTCFPPPGRASRSSLHEHLWVNPLHTCFAAGMRYNSSFLNGLLLIFR